jgi:hypothetical protein
MLAAATNLVIVLGDDVLSSCSLRDFLPFNLRVRREATVSDCPDTKSIESSLCLTHLLCLRYEQDPHSDSFAAVCRQAIND